MSREAAIESFFGNQALVVSMVKTGHDTLRIVLRTKLSLHEIQKLPGQSRVRRTTYHGNRELGELTEVEITEEELQKYGQFDLLDFLSIVFSIFSFIFWFYKAWSGGQSENLYLFLAVLGFLIHFRKINQYERV
jgi:hypothetical protein